MELYATENICKGFIRLLKRDMGTRYSHLPRVNAAKQRFLVSLSCKKTPSFACYNDINVSISPPQCRHFPMVHPEPGPPVLAGGRASSLSDGDSSSLLFAPTLHFSLQHKFLFQ